MLSSTHTTYDRNCNVSVPKCVLNALHHKIYSIELVVLLSEALCLLAFGIECVSSAHLHVGTIMRLRLRSDDVHSFATQFCFLVPFGSLGVDGRAGLCVIRPSGAAGRHATLWSWLRLPPELGLWVACSTSVRCEYESVSYRLSGRRDGNIVPSRGRRSAPLPW